MDLIAQIVTLKKKEFDVLAVAQELVTDIITYEKLSQHPQFSDINHPIVAAKCPALSKVDSDPIYNEVYRKLFPVIVDSVGYSPFALDLREQTKRESILQKTLNVNINVYSLSALREEPAEYIYVTHKDNHITYHLIIMTNNNGALICYHGREDEQNHTIDNVTTYRPLTKSIDSHKLDLVSYSFQGNNDYHFAYIDQKPVRIRNGSMHVDEQVIPLNMTRLAFMTDINDIATYLLETYIAEQQEVIQ